MIELTAERLREVLIYDPETGVFTWRVRMGSRAMRGSRAGSRANHGYWLIRVYWRGYPAARLAWLYMTGAWPSATIDHINRVRDDDRFANLREATRQEQHGNKDLYARNTSGVRGVNRNKRTGRWRAHIGTNGRMRHLGFFDTKEAAADAYNAAAREQFGEFYEQPNGKVSPVT